MSDHDQRVIAAMSLIVHEFNHLDGATFMQLAERTARAYYSDVPPVFDADAVRAGLNEGLNDGS